MEIRHAQTVRRILIDMTKTLLTLFGVICDIFGCVGVWRRELKKHQNWEYYFYLKANPPLVRMYVFWGT